MSDAKNWIHHNPVRIVCAPLEALSGYVTAQRVLLVTTQGFVKRGVAQRVKDILDSHQVVVWDGVRANPDLEDLDAATESLRSLDIGCVVGLGGGSALDAAKVLATTLSNSGETKLFHVFREQKTLNWTKRLPLIAIPTTSGTGAEVTPFATVWDHREHKKHSMAGDFVYPDVALLDVSLTLTLGEDDTLFPALDAISHALESLWNKNSTPVSRALAFQALALSDKALPVVIKEPDNLKARENLQSASLLAGLAISHTRTAIAHSLSYPLTAHFLVPHGLACSFGLSQILKENINCLQTNEAEKIILENIFELLIKFKLAERLKIYSVDKNKIERDFHGETQRSGNYSGDITKAKSLITELIESKL